MLIVLVAVLGGVGGWAWWYEKPLTTVAEAPQGEVGQQTTRLVIAQAPALVDTNVMLRAPGSLTSGEIDAVFGVGPSAPTTKRGFSSVEYRAQMPFAIFAASRLMSYATCARP